MPQQQCSETKALDFRTDSEDRDLGCSITKNPDETCSVFDVSMTVSSAQARMEYLEAFCFCDVILRFSTSEFQILPGFGHRLRGGLCKRLVITTVIANLRPLTVTGLCKFPCKVCCLVCLQLLLPRAIALFRLSFTDRIENGMNEGQRKQHDRMLHRVSLSDYSC